ncbi:MAG: HPP family protein [Anaerolineae bacterium]|nr:HPP family protein [Anaerolineae bacterium]
MAEVKTTPATTPWGKILEAKVNSGIPYPNWREVLSSGLGGLLIIGLLNYISLETDIVKAFIIPFGATAVLVFAAPAAPFSQPRNFIGGHLIAGASGIVVMLLFNEVSWLTLGLANGLAIALMVVTKCVHPPAGATALLPVVNSVTSFTWLLTPVLVGCLIILVVALLYNNVWAKRKYPAYWF